MASRLIYNVVRRPGGWAVEFDGQSLCCYRRQVEAVARARQLGREGWCAGGAPSEILVEVATGRLHTEVVFGHDRTGA
jgi:hypothetical protein